VVVQCQDPPSEHGSASPNRASSFHIQFPTQVIRNPLRHTYPLCGLETNGILPPARCLCRVRSGAQLVSPQVRLFQRQCLPSHFRNEGTLLWITDYWPPARYYLHCCFVWRKADNVSQKQASPATPCRLRGGIHPSDGILRATKLCYVCSGMPLRNIIDTSYKLPKYTSTRKTMVFPVFLWEDLVALHLISLCLYESVITHV
jgi:hypothetical protein